VFPRHRLATAGTRIALEQSELLFARERNMTPSSAGSQTLLKVTQARAHPFCLVCSPSNPMGLALEFVAQEDGSVSASFLAHRGLEGFEGCVHGGIIASLLDGAMTNCLFAHGRVAMTGELKVRYREPVVIGEEMLIRAWITRSHSPLHVLEAELKQHGCLRATASAKFVERNERNGHRHHAG
jgi:acyl-coenzyme A thioesterase PaaI-like protein